MDVLLQRHYENARLELIEQTRIEATEAGIIKVKEKRELQRLLQEQALLAAEESAEKDQDEYEDSNPTDDRSSVQPSVSLSASQKVSSTIKEDDENEEMSSSQTAIQTDSSTHQTESDVPPDNPEVQAFVQQAIDAAMIAPILLPPEAYMEVLDEAISALSETNKDRYPGSSTKGGWVIDNFPPLSEHWAALSEKGLLPDIVICLKNSEQNGRLLLTRLYQAHKEEIDAKIIKRLVEEALKKKQEEEEAKRELQEMLRLQEEELAEDRESIDLQEQPSESQSKIQDESEPHQTVKVTESDHSKKEEKVPESELLEDQREAQTSMDLKEHSESTEHIESDKKFDS
nr:PREDICTED: adenylate kinase 9-like [Anolis carolinensis]|eukprot:XP_016854853.1 PREDICTED: adenylate kinase 9-like [Anolis carolinensis]